MEVFCGFCLFCLVRLVVLLLLVGFYMCGCVGVLLFSTICGGFCFGFVFPLYCFYQKSKLPKKSLNSIQSRD